MPKRNLKQQLLQLLSLKHALSVQQMMEELDKKGEGFNKTSLYRALDQLVAQDQICKLNLTENESVYELREDHHAHLVCKVCGKVKVVPCNYEQPSATDGFTIDHHHLELIGTCDSCQK